MVVARDEEKVALEELASSKSATAILQEAFAHKEELQRRRIASASNVVVLAEAYREARNEHEM